MKSLRWLTGFFSLAVLGLLISNVSAQTPDVLYTWPATTSDWFKNFGAGTGTLANSGGALAITETSGTARQGAAWTDGVNTIRDTPALFGSGCCGGLDVTGLTSLQ